MLKEEKRKGVRFKFRHTIQYEKRIDDQNFALPVTVPCRDINMTGISFYTAERMALDTTLRINLSLGKEEIIFLGKVARMELSEDSPIEFLVGVGLEDAEAATKAKISKLINKINIFEVLDQIDLQEVTDINFVAGYPPVLKKFGKLEFTKGTVFSTEDLKALLLNILDEDRYRIFLKEKEINFVLPYKEGIRLRVNLHVQQGRTEGVFRLIPAQINPPHQLGLPVITEEMMENKKGLILVAGRTGSGKTTTLASMIDHLNRKREGIVICIEKPIEYLHTNDKCIIKQREVGRDTLSFSNAAKNALRQNPDVLVIGEILDTETMEVAITAAETGMLVLTSIHAADSAQALDRIVSFFPAELQKHMLTRISLILRGVITQNLVPRKDGKGLVVGAEVLIINDAMRRVVRDGDWKQIPTIIMTGRNAGMQSMRMSLEQYFLKGVIDGEYLKEYT
ncbi:PilT/PilU family type 4a pilus ATPase [Candidatus Omnitrophota bacterium]